MTSETSRGSGRAGESAMHRAAKLVWTYLDDEGGMTAIEYGLIASIISISILLLVTQIGISLQMILGQATNY
jgi:Flp pilus assembly pilin Flp